MMRLLLVLALLLSAADAAAAAAAAPAARSSATAYVDPLLASRGGAGFGGWGAEQRNPGAMAPFPFLRLGPDTTRVDPVLGEAWSKLSRHAGYFGSDNAIRAFSHTHLQGAGDADLGNVGVMPVRGGAAAIAALAAQRPLVLPFPPLTLDRSPFRQPVVLGRPDEEARPGYYRVALRSINVIAELAASGTHAGAHRYTCASGVAPGGGGAPASGPCALVVDVCHRTHDKTCGAATAVSLAQGASAASWLITGVHNDAGEFVRFNYSGVQIFFCMQISAAAAGAPLAPVEMGVWRGYELVSNTTSSATVGADRDSLGAFIVFPPPAADGAPAAVTIEVRVGLSTVSAAAAAANLQAEQGDGRGAGGLVPFEAVAAASDAAWATLLGAVTVTPAADAASGASDVDALAAGLAESRNGGALDAAEADIGAAAEAALAAFLETPDGAAIALSHGWASVPASWPPAIEAWRAGGVQPAASTLAALARERPRVDFVRALGALRAGVAASRAGAAAVRATDPVGADLAVFYTMLYLSFCAPSTYNDDDGRYLGFDGIVHNNTAGASFLSDLSLWDTHRSQAPLLALAAPRALADTAASLLNMAQQGSMGMPRWPFANLYTE
jgi:putative alpha-1,2-mannosidase